MHFAGRSRLFDGENAIFVVFRVHLVGALHSAEHMTRDEAH
jgi:hypothetical protein